MSNAVTIFGRQRLLSPQAFTIFKHLVNVGEISGVEAQAMYKARSLTRRITEINDAIVYVSGGAFRVGREWKVDAAGQRYVRYFLSTIVRDNSIFGGLPAPASVTSYSQSLAATR